MLKQILLTGTLLIASSMLMAGDVAAFVDEGFSADGSIYVFGQYGSVDKTWQGYAEIYTVDIAENDYVDGAVFKTPASSKTAGSNGYTLYSDLQKSNSKYLESLRLNTVDIDNVLFINNDSKNANTKISITDFESAANGKAQMYSVTLTPWYSGNTATSQSSFYISIEKHDENGTLLGKQVIGNPDIKRRGVIGYNLEKIIKSPDGESFIFVIEKTVATASGNSIRYMVETLEVGDF